MKNIYLISTNKPSRLCFRNYLFINKDNIGIYSNVEFKNIYITSDEEIKEVDYGLIGNDIGKIILTEDGYEFLIGIGVSYTYGDLHSLKKVCKKIILTTDQDLIKDGVQAIDDEFLNWFIKNPSCEFVEWSSERIEGSFDGENWSFKYGTIIPKEEANIVDKFKEYLSNTSDEQFKKDWEEVCKQTEGVNSPTVDEYFEHLEKNLKYPIGGYAPGTYTCICVTCKNNFMGDKRAVQCELCAKKQETTKQETLEEAAEKYIETSHYMDKNRMTDIMFGAKWQEKRSYSEEEVLVLLHKRDAYNFKTNAQSLLDWETPKEWFNKFKKK